MASPSRSGDKANSSVRRWLDSRNVFWHQVIALGLRRPDGCSSPSRNSRGVSRPIVLMTASSRFGLKLALHVEQARSC